MPLLSKRWFRITLAILLVGGLATYLMANDKSADGSVLEAVAQRGHFAVTVTTSGELQALSAVEIKAPEKAQEAGAFQMKIASLVPEGTIVKAGDKVAELDRSTLATRMQEVSLAMQKAQAVYEQAALDSTLALSKAREDIRNMELALEEKKLAKEQAIYEAPTIKRQAEIDYERAERALKQGKLDYVTRVAQSDAKMREVGTDLTRQKDRMQAVQDVMGEFTIMAPAPGMVIYRKEWNGKKRGVGGQVSAWDPVVATLPDLTRMESITYVNEIDIKKLSIGQPVTLKLDSDPDKLLTGTVTKVANVGEERPNTDAKVFEVRIEVTQSDTSLRPGMTTSNGILTFEADSVLHVPIEAIDNAEGVPFVYLRRGGKLVRQEVVAGEMNEDAVIIERGLSDGDVVLLTTPSDGMSKELIRLPGSPVGAATAAGDTATGAARVPAAKSTDSTRP